MVFLREELRARHKSVWLLEWGLERVVQRGLGYMLKEIFLGVYLERVVHLDCMSVSQNSGLVVRNLDLEPLKQRTNRNLKRTFYVDANCQRDEIREYKVLY